jgi:glycosyltransferase involved in cell wall biosynthesis
VDTLLSIDRGQIPAANAGEGRRLKIAIMGSTYARYHEDSQIPWMREAVNRLAARGHEMTVIVPSFKGLGNHRIDGIEVLRFRYAPRWVEQLTHDEGAPNKLRNPIYQFLGLTYIIMGTLCSILWSRKRKFDVINVHWPFPHGIFALCAARFSGAKVVAMCHGAELAMGRRKPWIRNVLRRCLLGSDRLACNSSHTGSEIEKICGRTATVIPYGATITVAPAPVDRPPPSRSEPATILFTGRHIQRKGVPYLIRAMPRLLESRPVRLLITGDGDRRGEWEALTRSLGLSNVVEFLGFVSNERLAELYRDCDVYVLPAIFDDRGDTEGLGVVLVEALSSAKPVVASAVGGIVDVIKHEETGLLVPEKDEAALATAILRLLDDPELATRLGTAGRKLSQSYFDWDRTIDDTEALFYDALDEAGPATQETLPAPDDASPPLPAEAVKGPRKPWARAGRGLLVAAVLFFILSALRHYSAEVRNQVTHIHLGWLFAGYLLCSTYRVLNSAGWVMILRGMQQRMPMLRGMRLWIMAESMRWLPGSIWGFASRVYQASRNGVPPVVASASVPLELLLTIAAWTVVAGGGILASGRSVDWRALLTPRLIAFCAAGIFAVMAFVVISVCAFPQSAFGGKLRKLASQLGALRTIKLRWGVFAGVFAYYTALCCFNGLAFYVVLRSVSDAALNPFAVIGINACGWLLGTLAVGAPAGLGVRDAGTAMLLSAVMPLPAAIGGSVLWRVVMIMDEVICLSACLLPALAANLKGTPVAASLAPGPVEKITLM